MRKFVLAKECGKVYDLNIVYNYTPNRVRARQGRGIKESLQMETVNEMSS
jgi:hypothetical protein